MCSCNIYIARDNTYDKYDKNNSAHLASNIHLKPQNLSYLNCWQCQQRKALQGSMWMGAQCSSKKIRQSTVQHTTLCDKTLGHCNSLPSQHIATPTFCHHNILPLQKFFHHNIVLYYPVLPAVVLLCCVYSRNYQHYTICNCTD